MVHAVHQQAVRRDGVSVLRRFDFAQENNRKLRVGGKTLGVVVPAAHKGSQHRRPVRRTPFKFIRQLLAFTPVAAPENTVPDAEIPENLRQLADQPELVGDITATGACAERFRLCAADQEVPYRRLAAGEEEVVLDIPGADFQVAGTDIAFQFLPPFRADLKVILKADGLRVQFKHIFGRFAEDFQKVVDQVHQPMAELFKRLIPLPVPMGMRNDVEGFHNDPLSVAMFLVVCCKYILL
ncbi:hypothetical protein SDC9_116028 [bioreactor metagenome]|uniref:Uncharacterized protein n=1 Tax=bioreactor metagenome TaxID=1076179 RepID=A0A645C551_9ZZZZ